MGDGDTLKRGHRTGNVRWAPTAMHVFAAGPSWRLGRLKVVRHSIPKRQPPSRRRYGAPRMTSAVQDLAEVWRGLDQKSSALFWPEDHRSGGSAESRLLIKRVTSLFPDGWLRMRRGLRSCA